MPKTPRLLWLAVPLVWLLYFFRPGAAGLIGPDEPRYASIGRAMAQSGDWVTPRLWGQPWFEKPALLYWMTGIGFRLGLGPELAPRLPVAFLAVSFLAFFWWIARREFGYRTAWFATLILGTSGLWVAYSQVGVTDVPLAATFSAALLLMLPSAARGETKHLPMAGALLGLAVLTKGLVPLVLIAPAIPMLWRKVGLKRAVLAAAFLVLVAAPWYILCYLRNGSVFLKEFFWRHHFERLVSGGLMHSQPWWFYLPVFAGALLPWSPLIVLAGKRATKRDPRRLLLLVSVLFGILFFSVAINKLPGYVMPLLPAAALLAGIALDETPRAEWWLASCALLLAAFPIAAPMLGLALESGLSKAPRPAFQLSWLLPLAVATAGWVLERRRRRLAAVTLIAAGCAAGVAYVKQTALPDVDRLASARSLWRKIADRPGEVCVEKIDRTWRYGLNYYSAAPLPECSEKPKPVWIRQVPGQPPTPGPPGEIKVDPASLNVVISPFRN